MKKWYRKLTERITAWLNQNFGQYAVHQRLAEKIEQTRRGETLLIEPSPTVSIVIPVYNGLTYVRECIENIYKSTTGVRFEVVVIDQNSTDGTREMLREMRDTLPHFRLVENAANVGFGRAINQGAALAQGEFLSVSNSDLVMTPGWLEPLVRALRDDPSLAVVSPMTNYVGEGPQVDPKAAEVTPALAPFYAQAVAGRSGILQVPDRLVFFCVLIPMRVFDLLGGLSDVFGLGNYEDDDFCFRARMLGYKLGIVKNAFVFHYGSRTFKEQKIDYTDLMLKNEQIFYDRIAKFALRVPVLSSLPPSSHAPDISVIVRTKDRPFLLREALLSLANQFFDNFEVIVVNDGGEDVSALLEDLEPHLRFTYIFHKTAQGRAAALNAGARSAKACWITYLDDDDIVYPNHLALLWAAVQQYPKTKVVYADVNKALLWSDFIGQDMKLVERKPFGAKEFNADLLLVGNWIPIMSFMHVSEAFQTVGMFDEHLDVFEDWDLLIRMARLWDFKHIRRVTSEYRFRFGESLGDSTLSLREKALGARLTLYERYPVRNTELLQMRDEAVGVSVQQMSEMREVIDLQACDLQRSYLIAAYLGGFSLDFRESL